MEIIVNKDISIKQFILISVLVIIAGIGALYVSLEGFIKVNILKNYKVEFAKIYYSEIVNTSREDDNSTYRRVVRYNFSVDGKNYSGEDTLWWKFFSSDINAKVGDDIKIIYNINNPEENKVYHISYLFIIFGIGINVFMFMALKKRIQDNDEDDVNQNFDPKTKINI